MAGADEDLKFVNSDLIALLNCERAVLREVPAVGSIKVFESVNAIYTPIAVTITVAVLLALYSPVPSAATILKLTL